MSDSENNPQPKHELSLRNFRPKVDTKVQELAQFIENEWDKNGQPLVNVFSQAQQIAGTSEKPSEILQALRDGVAQGEKLASFFGELATKADGEMGQLIVRRTDMRKGELAKYEDDQSYHRRQRDLHESSEGDAGLGVAAGIFISIFTLGLGAPIAIGSGLAAMDSQDKAKTEQKKIDNIQSDIDRLKEQVDVVRREQGEIPVKLSPNQEVAVFEPRLMAHEYAHAQTIYSEIEKYAQRHRTSVDKIAEHLKKQSPKAHGAYLALIRAQYSTGDLVNLAEYARDAEITNSPEQASLLQFVNHSLVPHMDYFEVWASKVHDLSQAIGNIKAMISNVNPSLKPQLELLGDKPISLSGTRALAKQLDAIPAHPSAKEEAAEDAALLRKNAETTVRSLIGTLNDQTVGPLRTRHDMVRDQSLQQLRQFNGLFAGIDQKLRETDTRLHMLPGQIDGVDFKLNRAIGDQMMRERVEAMDPDIIHVESSAANVVGEGLRIFIEDGFVKTARTSLAKGIAKLTGRTISSEAKTVAARIRQEREFAIMKKAASLKRDIDPAPLKKQLDELEKEYVKLVESQEFLKYLSGDPSLEKTRAMFMLLPRLNAGEGNIDALEATAQVAGYKQLDEFIDDLDKRNPRLGDAMKHYACGIANTNDLRVIVSEANTIEEPKDRMEKTLVRYVENVIKGNYRDIARQCSTMDFLEIRNVVYTGKPFHSFDEIVKYETDAALQALLSGKGDFNLVGSNDVRQIFDYYQDRHGEGDVFKDVHDPQRLITGRVNAGNATSKRANAIRTDEIKLKRREAVSDRHPSIPRLSVSGIFTEICAYEYFLSQGKNVVKDKSLASNPEYPGILEMVNSVTEEFVKRLALDAARARKKGGDRSKPEELGPEIESLIAQTFVDFFSELGAIHSADQALKDKRQKVKNAYTGENYAVPLGTFTQIATASANNSFDLFLDIYQRNLEKYLEVATRDNRKKLMAQLDEVKDLMQHVQPSNQTLMPDSEAARMKAHYRNHSLSNLGVNPSTWVARAEAIHKGGKEVS